MERRKLSKIFNDLFFNIYFLKIYSRMRWGHLIQSINTKLKIDSRGTKKKVGSMNLEEAPARREKVFGKYKRTNNSLVTANS